MIKFKLDTKKLKKLTEKRTLKPPTVPTGIISRDLKKEVDMRFRNERDPEGNPWKPLRLNTILGRYAKGRSKKGSSFDQQEVLRLKRRGWKNSQIERTFKLQKGTVSKLAREGSKKTTRGRTKILQDTGTLKRSISMRHNNSEAVVGTNIKYAKVHNFGYKKRNIPARPFMGLSRKQREKYREIIRKWKNGEL